MTCNRSGLSRYSFQRILSPSALSQNVKTELFIIITIIIINNNNNFNFKLFFTRRQWFYLKTQGTINIHYQINTPRSNKTQHTKLQKH
jgi:hypothetical protein